MKRADLGTALANELFVRLDKIIKAARSAKAGIAKQAKEVSRILGSNAISFAMQVDPERFKGVEFFFDTQVKPTVVRTVSTKTVPTKKAETKKAPQKKAAPVKTPKKGARKKKAFKSRKHVGGPKPPLTYSETRAQVMRLVSLLKKGHTFTKYDVVKQLQDLKINFIPDHVSVALSTEKMGLSKKQISDPRSKRMINQYTVVNVESPKV